MKKPGKTKEDAPNSTGANKYEELKTDYPLSEKDQMKQAEEKMRKKKAK